MRKRCRLFQLIIFFYSVYSRSNRIWWSLERKERNNRNAILRPRSVGGAGAVLTVLPIDRQCGMIDMCDRVRRNHVTDRALAKWTSVRETVSE